MWAGWHPERLSPATITARHRTPQPNRRDGEFLPGERRPAGQLLLPTSPANFYSVAANSWDITKADGYKNYQLCNACVTSFGTLYNNSVPRLIQFGVKVCF